MSNKSSWGIGPILGGTVLNLIKMVYIKYFLGFNDSPTFMKPSEKESKSRSMKNPLMYMNRYVGYSNGLGIQVIKSLPRAGIG